MAEILGLHVTDYPMLRMKPHHMAPVLMSNMARGWAGEPKLRDPANWPDEMRLLWGRDQGGAAAKAAQQRQITQLRRVRAALDDFGADFAVVLFREVGPLGNDPLPPFRIHAIREIDARPYQLVYPGGFSNRENYFEEDPEKVERLHGHTEAADLLLRYLKNEAGYDPVVAREPLHEDALGHLFAAAVHLDWDRRQFKLPLLPISFDPFGFGRIRSSDGLSLWDKSAPNPPLAPQQAFDLGRAITRAFKNSPWRVAIVAATDWSHANDTDARRFPLHPDVRADQIRHEQWAANKFADWGANWTFEEMEEHGQWQMIMTIALAGAMTELGGHITYSDFQPNVLFNTDYVTSVF